MTGSSARVTLLVALMIGVCAAVDAQGTRVVNENYGFALQLPADWTAQRTKQTDPFPDINEFKAGRAKLSGSIDTGAAEPADWNALHVNGSQEFLPDGTLKFPQITVYAHPHAARTFDEFSKDLGEWLQLFGMKLTSSQQLETAGGVAIYDYVYTMGPMPIRLAMVYGNGVRYGFMFTGRDMASFKNQGAAVEKFVTSLELTKPKAPAPVK